MAAQDLPKDLLISIFLRLPIKSLICCRSVCKSWLNIFCDPSFIHTHSVTYPQSSKILLIKEPSPSDDEGVTEEEQLQFIKFCKERFSESARFKIPHLIKGCISRKTPYGLLGPCNGLLCIHGPLNRKSYQTTISAYKICMWNPTTGEIKVLPKLKMKELRHRGTKFNLTPVACGFGHIPNPHNRDTDMDDYKVVVILQDPELLKKHGAAKIHIFVYSLNTDSWEKINSNYATNNFVSLDWTNSSGLFFKGALHWIVQRKVPTGKGPKGSAEHKICLLAIHLDDDDDEDKDRVCEIDLPQRFNVSGSNSLSPWVCQGSILAFTALYEGRRGLNTSVRIMVDSSSIREMFVAGSGTIKWGTEEEDEEYCNDHILSLRRLRFNDPTRIVFSKDFGNGIHWSQWSMRLIPLKWKLLSSRERERVKTALCWSLLESGDEELVLYDAKEFYRFARCNPGLKGIPRGLLTRYLTCTLPYKQTIVSPN